MLTDPIADFLTRLRNASHARRRTVTVRSSRMLKAIAQTLLAKQFIESVSETKEGETNMLTITLRTDRQPLELKRISKPGQRIYVSAKEVKRVRSGLGIGLISTSRGIVPDSEAREKKIGGEYLCEVY